VPTSTATDVKELVNLEPIGEMACALLLLKRHCNFVLRAYRIFAAVAAIAMAPPWQLFAQNVHGTASTLGRIVGTVIDVNGDPVPDAKVELKSSAGVDRRIVTPETGFFEFQSQRDLRLARLDSAATASPGNRDELAGSYDEPRIHAGCVTTVGHNC